MGRKPSKNWDIILDENAPKYDVELFEEIFDKIFANYTAVSKMDEHTVLMTTAAIAGRIMEHTGQDVPLSDIYRWMNERGFKETLLSELQFVWLLQPNLPKSVRGLI